MAGLRSAGDESVAGPVDREAVHDITAARSYISYISEAGAGNIQFGDKPIGRTAAIRRLKHRRGGRKVGRTGVPPNIGVAARVYSERLRAIIGASTQKGEVGQTGAGRVEFGHEGVEQSVVRRLSTSGRRTAERGRIAIPGDIRAAR